LHHRLPAIGDERVADNKSRSIRTKPEDGVRNFFRPTHSSDWLLRNDLGASFRRAAGETAHHRSIDVAGTDRVDANVLRSVVERSRASKPDHGVLSSGISRATFNTDDACSR